MEEGISSCSTVEWDWSSLEAAVAIRRNTDSACTGEARWNNRVAVLLVLCCSSVVVNTVDGWSFKIALGYLIEVIL